MTKILFTTVCRPFGGAGEGDSVGAELFHAQVTRAQGIFSFRQVIRCWGLDYIAHNIDAPSTVLHYPSKGELIRELSRGSYDYVGINFVVATFHKAREAVALIRRHSPQSKIILGGYGTVLPDAVLAPFSDFICREEGVRFVRRLLGEQLERPIAAPFAPIPAPNVFSYGPPRIAGHITGGLGCPNGCDFCCTSHFFKRRYVPFIESGRELLATMKRMESEAAARGERMSGFIFIDEDFFLHKRRAREFLEAVREDGTNRSIMGFGSVRGLSQFTPSEIAEMGFDTVWTAVEGEGSGYGKLKGTSIETLYAGLKAHGINILSSMIIGFPYQNRERIETEFNRLLKLNPTMSQILIYFAFPGTPFHDQVLKEGRYRENFRERPDLRRWDGFSMHFDHPLMEPGEIEKLQKDLYRREFETLGPSVIRLIRVWQEGYQMLHSSENALLRSRAERLKNTIRAAFPVLLPGMLFGPSKGARALARTTYRSVVRQCGPFSATDYIKMAATLPLSAWTSLTLRARIFQQPGLLRLEYPVKSIALQPAVTRLRGGFFANPLKAFLEDIGRLGAEGVARIFPRRTDHAVLESAKAVTNSAADPTLPTADAMRS